MKQQKFGVSFSIKAARQMGINPKQCLESSLKDLGAKRLRLMSYWDEHEKLKDTYDFKELDWQIKLAEKYSAEVTLCLGLKQPRWPESHWPEWAKTLPDKEWQEALLRFIETIVIRYKDRKCIISWQLENEALLKNFGAEGNFDRRRLYREFELIKSLDARPIIMSTSDSYGVPIHGPTPDIYGFSVYRYFFRNGRYRFARRPALFYRFRAMLIRLKKNTPCFIHELQAEPWGPQGTEELSLDEQFESMNFERVKEAVSYARTMKLWPVDIWGLEWWYYLKTKHNQPEIWNFMHTVFSETSKVK